MTTMMIATVMMTRTTTTYVCIYNIWFGLYLKSLVLLDWPDCNAEFRIGSCVF